MERSKIIELLSKHQSELKELGVRSLALFGSVSRDSARPDSDVDFVVEFDGSATFDGYMNLKEYLERLLNQRVDLVTHKALKPRIRPRIEKEAIRVA